MSTNTSLPLVRHVFLLLACLLWAGASAQDTSPPHRVYSHLLEPREHPDYGRRAVKPPTWETFKNRTQFTCLRGFAVENDLIKGYVEELEKFTRTHELGDVIWPSYPILFAKNLGDLADEIKKRDLYLFDVWGYVPGSGPGGYWQQFVPPPESFETLESKLGERWLGTDIGEQDGRYVGGYAEQMTPSSANRFEQYLNFQRHFERMGDDLGHKHATLVSLNFGHYFLKEGTYTLIGAETAQALPNNQVYYAFIRGAGKQYGVPWFGNASIYNRWGYKTYGGSGKSDGYEYGPTKGTSLSLMKRLLYNHIFYNSVAVGFENGWFEGNSLSPLGRIQQSAQRWVKEHGQPGVMHTPVALLLDFHSGWSFPRHLYTDKVYRVWGNLPYEPGDFLTDAVLDLLYPGYQDSSYFHDESGFISPTPYGDIADCLLSDSPAWLLARYPVLVLAGSCSGGRELRDKLQDYLENGGQLLLTAGNLTKLPGGLGGHTSVSSDLTATVGKGTLTVFVSEFGVERNSTQPPSLRSEVDRPLSKPYSLRPEVRQALRDVFAKQALFETGNRELSLVTCRKSRGAYRLCISNNTWREQKLKITSRCGDIESIRELSLDESEKSGVGYTPEGTEVAMLGSSGEGRIAGGDVRIFEVQVKEAGVEEIAHIAPQAWAKDRVLPLRRLQSIKEEIIARPTFFEHFDGVVVDWRYLADRETAALQREAPWIRRQSLNVYVDLSSGVNLYPGLRLINNLPADYLASMKTITNLLGKMEALGARNLIFSLHRHPENNFSGEETQAAFEHTLRELASSATDHGITLHLRMAFGKPPWNIPEAVQMLDRIGAPNIRLAPSTALIAQAGNPADLAKLLPAKVGVWLVASPRSDIAGRMWDAHGPIHSSAESQRISSFLGLSPGRPIILDANYPNYDHEYLDALALRQLVPDNSNRSAEQAKSPSL